MALLVAETSAAGEVGVTTTGFPQPPAQNRQASLSDPSDPSYPSDHTVACMADRERSGTRPLSGWRPFVRLFPGHALRYGHRSISGLRSGNPTQISLSFPLMATAGRGRSAGPGAFPATRSPWPPARASALLLALHRHRLPRRTRCRGFSSWAPSPGGTSRAAATAGGQSGAGAMNPSR